MLNGVDEKFSLNSVILYDYKFFDKNVGLNKTEKKVIELLIENPSYNSEDLAEKIGVTKRTIERTFKTLQEKKRIERIGSKRDGNWIVAK